MERAVVCEGRGWAGAFAAALAGTLIGLIIRVQSSSVARTALMVALGMLAYGFGENLEVLVYLFWPGLILIGRACAEETKLLP